MEIVVEKKEEDLYGFLANFNGVIFLREMNLAKMSLYSIHIMSCTNPRVYRPA